MRIVERRWKSGDVRRVVSERGRERERERVREKLKNAVLYLGKEGGGGRESKKYGYLDHEGA